MTHVFSLVQVIQNDVEQIQLRPGEFSRSILLVQPGDAVAVRQGWDDPNPFINSRHLALVLSIAEVKVNRSFVRDTEFQLTLLHSDGRVGVATADRRDWIMVFS
jgi:hypothetical protein